MTRARRLLLVLPALLAALVLPARGAQPIFKKGTLTLLAPGKRVVLQVEVADTPAARAQGLMFRRSLPESAGMLFVFETEGRWGFWMKNTLIPLSIAFIDRYWKIVDIQDMAVAPDPQAGPFTIYEARAPARYALEVRQGLFRKHNVTVGTRVIFRRHE
jgi:uncharacterized membrane protein (UPF0127 family)